MVECTCTDKNCKTSIVINISGITLIGKDSQISLMYVDANAVVDLIHELKSLLGSIVMGDV